MPYIIVTSVFPSDKGKEVAERYLEVLGKYPPDENVSTEVVPGAVIRTENGLKTMTIIDVKPGKLEEAFFRNANALAMLNDIQGYEGTMDICLKFEEAMATIGMSMPG